ncbi:hypothetical protein SynTAK9802_00462 [Synechococcus sp. TAK9802]|nr:hypothetical protein SynTAK9802_00462 [Synechococcus sp. TAK9802]
MHRNWQSWRCSGASIARGSACLELDEGTELNPAKKCCVSI